MVTLIRTALLFPLRRCWDIFVSRVVKWDRWFLILRFLVLYTFFISTSFFFRFIRKRGKIFYGAIVALSVFSMWASFASSRIFLFLLRFEIIVLPLYALIYNFSKGKDKILSVLFIIFFNLFGSVPFIIFSLKIINFTSLGLSVNLELREVCFSLILAICYITVFLRKIPVLFIHFWLPKAHGRSSGTCSIILARLVLKLGTFGLLKFGLLLLLSDSLVSFLCRFSMLGCLIFSLFMYRFFDLKYLVACSSILHMGVILPSMCFFRRMSVLSSFLIIVSHGFVSFFLFYLVTLVYEGVQRRSSSLNKSLESHRKNIAIMLYVCLFLNLRVPPTINFLREVEICCSFFNFSLYPSVIFLASMLSNIFFTILVCSNVLFGKKISKSKEEGARATNTGFFLTLLFLIVGPFLICFFSLYLKPHFVVVKN